MIKVVYFDNSSAIDYLNIYNGGERIQTDEEIQKNTEELTTKANESISAKLGWLPFFSANAEAGIDAEINSNDNSLVKTTISNTILTDFIEKSSNDSRLIKFEGYKLRAYKNSITFFKMFTPYLKMTKSDIQSDGVTFDLAKIDESFESGKGYYELIAEKIENRKNKKYIFRFNINAFRNNYTMADLIKMDLNYTAVKVGKAYENMLDIEKEINVETQIISSAFEIGQTGNDELEIYDIILAGVEI